MKLIVALVVVAIVLLLMCGCQKNIAEIPKTEQIYEYSFIIWADPSQDSLYIVRKTDGNLSIDSTAKFVINSSDSTGLTYTFKGNNNFIFSLKSIGQDGHIQEQYNVKNY